MDSQSNNSSDVIYYSINFLDDYNGPLKAVYENVLKRREDATQGLFKKNGGSFETFIANDISDKDKEIILKNHKKEFSKLNLGDVFIVFDGVLYKINDEFHITTLFTGGRNHEKCDEMEKQIGKKIKVPLKKIGVSKDFIVFGVGDLNCSYYGNEIKHITFGLSMSGQKVFPKDSYKALANGKIYDVNDGYGLEFEGIASKFMKK